MLINDRLDTLLAQLDKLKGQGYTPVLNQGQVKVLLKGYGALRSYVKVLEDVALKDGVDVTRLWEDARRWSPPPEDGEAIVPQKIRLLGYTYVIEK